MAERSPNTPLRLRSAGFPFRRPTKARRPGPITALDVDDKVLRVAQLTPRGESMTVTRTDVAALEMASGADRNDAGAFGEAMAKGLRALHLKPAQVVMGVPRQLVVLRTLSLPLVQDLREMASMVHMQIGKDLPFKQDEAIIDFVVRRQVSQPTPSDANANQKPGVAKNGDSSPPAQPKVEVLVAALRRDTVEFYQKAAAAAKLKLLALGWLSQGNARCIEACGVTDGRECAALVTLRPDEVGIDVVKGSLLFSRGAAIQHSKDSVPDGLPVSDPLRPPNTTAGDSEDFINAVTIELVRSLHSYNGVESNPPVAKLVVAGVTGYESAVAEALQKRLMIPCTCLDPAEALNLPNAAREHAAGAVGAIGLGFGVNDPEGLPFDFLNPKRPAVQRNTRRIRILTWSAVAAVFLIALLGVRSHLMGERLRRSQEIQKELTQAEKNLPVYRSVQRQAGVVQNWVKGGRNWLEQYAYLSAILPGSEDLYITSLSVSGQGVIHLAVQARSGEILAELDKQLRAAGYEVKPLAITPGNDRHGYNFRTTVELLIPAKMKIDLSKAQPPERPDDDASLDAKRRSPRKGGRS